MKRLAVAVDVAVMRW